MIQPPPLEDFATIGLVIIAVALIFIGDGLFRFAHAPTEVPYDLEAKVLQDRTHNYDMTRHTYESRSHLHE